jgi:hypothetical protein
LPGKGLLINGRDHPPGPIQRLNRESARIPRRLRRGKRANHKKTTFRTVEDSLQLAAGNLQFSGRLALSAPSV